VGHYSIHKGKKPLRIIEKDYFESGDWKCPNSATGGHWWNCNIEPHVCKICGKVKLDPH
jgi:hypothetical protein